MSILSHSNALRKISEKSYHEWLMRNLQALPGHSRTTGNCESVCLYLSIPYSLIPNPSTHDLTSQVMRCIIPRCEVNRRLRAFGHEESPGTVGQGAG